MPLLDHFHSPGKDLLPSWETLHAGWASHIAETLNKQWLPREFLAADQSHVGPHVEIDVATFERPTVATAPASGNGPVATMPQTWVVPAVTCAVPAVFPDTFEVRVYAERGGWNLVGAVELVSPRNKDRAEERQAFATKVASYLHEGVSVVLIDIVTNRRPNLHNEVLGRLSGAEAARLPDEVLLYTAAYRPVRRDERSEIDIWTERCTIGAPLPTMPLRLTHDLFVPVEFEATYMETCRGRRII
jgi:Protein of unknown function (DUF4058)